jgi:radical SAM superfamily enzyme YgiQ (UPF0313 family)
MSNLGFQTVYHLLNTIEDVVCERSFLPEDRDSRSASVTSIESGRPISVFDVIAFSISYENDYPNLLVILDKAGIPLRSSDRGSPHPLVIAGGVACFSNPEPISRFVDCFLIGEAEAILPRFFEAFDHHAERQLCLKTIAGCIPGTYVPEFYHAIYDPEGCFHGLEPVADMPAKIERVFVKDLAQVSTCSAILTPHTTFDRTFLIEVARGCPHGCRFCSAGFIYRPPRFRPVSLLKKNIQQGLALTSKIGLLGAAVSDHPGIHELCKTVLHEDIHISFSSLRADALSPELLTTLKQSKVKTATIAPDAGSQRMRDVINKGITEEQILNASEMLVKCGIPNLKLYFMIGLPTETRDDVEAIVMLCKQIKHRFLKSSRIRKRIGEITVSLNCFVPKPLTPFQWVAMDDVQTLKNKIRKIKDGLKRVANVRVHADVPRWAYIQAMFSRGDRKVAQILMLAHENRGNWIKTLNTSPVNPDYYVVRERSIDECLPWDFIDHGINKQFLAREYQRALEGKPSLPCPLQDCTLCGVCTK